MDTSEIMRLARQAQETAQTRRTLILAESCPRCLVDSPQAATCSLRASEECKHKPALDHRARLNARRQNLSRSEVPGKFHEALAGDRISPGYEAVAWVRRLLAGDGILLVLSGTPGNGKSFAAGLAVAERGGWFLACGRLDGYRGSENTVERARTTRLLALDDVGRGSGGSKLALGRVEELLCARYDNNQPTVVTFNPTDSAPDRTGFLGLFGGPEGRVADRLLADPLGWRDCLEVSRRRGRNPTHFAEVDP